MEVKSDRVFCGVCRHECTKTFKTVRGKNSIFVDEHGAEWSGRKCPDCYKSYKEEYDRERRQRIGHRVLGSVVPCERAGCSNTLEVTKGSHRLCKECRNTK